MSSEFPSAAPVIHIDLFGGWDLFAFIFGLTAMGLNTILFIYAICNHKYPPLKAKNLPLITILYICMVIWFLGIIGTNFNLPNTYGFPGSCILLGSWFRILLGIFLFIFIHILRLHIYIQIFTKVKRVTYRVYLFSACIYLLILAAYGIPTTILKEKLTIKYVRALEVCEYGKVFREISFSLVWIGWAGILLQTYLARHINTSFKEYHEMLLISFISSMAIIYQTVIHHTVQQYLIIRWARVTSTMFEMIACQSSLFILLGEPAFNCLFRKEKYKAQWFAKMRADGMASKYNCFPDSNTSNRSDTLV